MGSGSNPSNVAAATNAVSSLSPNIASAVSRYGQMVSRPTQVAAPQFRAAPQSFAQSPGTSTEMIDVNMSPFQQAAIAQRQALNTTIKGTQYATDDRVLNRMGSGMGYQAPAAATNALTAGSGYGTNQGAMAGFRRAQTYNPNNIYGTSYNAAQQGTPATGASAMGAYQNPYETQVVNQTLRDIGTQAAMGRQNLAAQAERASAFGGSRHGIAEAEALKGYTQQMADTAARMRQQGFQTQLGAGQFDASQQGAAQARNLAAANQARQFAAQQAMTAQQLNQASGLQAQQLGLQASQAMSGADLQAAAERRASAGALGSLAAQQEQLGLGAARDLASANRADQTVRLGAANQLSNIGQTSMNYGLGIQDRMAQQGAMQRGIQQQLIDQAQAEQLRYRNAPAQGLNTMLGTVTGQTGNLTGNTVSQNPGLFNYLQVASQF